MTKAVTVRLDDDAYKMLSEKAKADKRSLANYIEVAATSFAVESEFVSDEEMNEILSDKRLVASMKRAQKDVALRRGRRVY